MKPRRWRSPIRVNIRCEPDGWYGNVRVVLSRRWAVMFGRFPIGGWKLVRDKAYDRREVSLGVCDRGCGSRLELRSWDNPLLSEWFYCPRCRYRHKTALQLERAARANAEHEGITLDEYAERCAQSVRKPTDAELAEIEQRIASDPKLRKRLGIEKR